MSSADDLVTWPMSESAMANPQESSSARELISLTYTYICVMNILVNLVSVFLLSPFPTIPCGHQALLSIIPAGGSSL